MSDTPQSNGPAAAGNSPLPSLVFDPFRLAHALLAGVRWILIGAAAGFLVMVIAGLLRARDSHIATARLLKREPSASFRAGEVGEPFRPRQVSSATLVSGALSDNVLVRVSSRANPPISTGMLRLAARATELRGTDFLELQIRHWDSREAASELVNLWAAEIVEFSKDLQSRESREVRAYLQRQIASAESDLRRATAELLDYSRRESLVDEERQTDVMLRQAAELDIRVEAARIEADTLRLKLDALEQELARYSPAHDRLASARVDLDAALARYTEENPEVIALRRKIAALEEEISTRKPGDTTLSSMAGTSLGGTLYLELLDLRSRVKGAAGQLEALEKTREALRAGIETLPAKIAPMARLRARQASLETALQLLNARLRESSLFADDAPGYYQLFSSAKPESVASTSRLLKVAAYGVAGIFLGAFAAAAFLLARELADRRLLSASEARRIFNAPLLAEICAGQEPAEASGSLWVTWAAHAERANRPAVVWTPHEEAAGEALWSALLAEARRLQPDLEVRTASADGGDLPLGSLTLDQARARAADLCHGKVWVRIRAETNEPALTFARSLGGIALVVPAGAATLPEWEHRARMLAESGVAIDGLIVTGTVPWWRQRIRLWK